jgi:ribokinase
MTLKFAVSGNANIDIYYFVEKIPQPDEAVEALEIRTSLGGAATNIATGISKLGHYVRFIGFVGSDPEATEVLSELKKRGIDVAYVKSSSKQTGRVIVLLDKEGRRAMIAHRGANSELRPGAFNPEETLRGIDHLHLSSTSPEYSYWFFREAKKMSISTSWDPGMTICLRGFKSIENVLQYVDVLFLNERENEALKIDPASMEKPLIIIKRGSEGSEAPQYKIKAEAFRVKALDATGAGDAFDAAFLVAWKRKIGLKESLIIANAAGAIKVTRFGAHSSPTASELAEFLEKNGREDLARLFKP